MEHCFYASYLRRRKVAKKEVYMSLFFCVYIIFRLSALYLYVKFHEKRGPAECKVLAHKTRDIAALASGRLI